MCTLWSNVKQVTTKYPLIRGILSYSVIWPTSALIQQKIAGQNWESIDWGRCARFSFYGALYVAPTLYTWIRISSRIWPRADLKSAIKKALVEQVTYTPAAMTSFYFLMSLLEGKSIEDAKLEVITKFVPTYTAAICVWPILSTFNFTVVHERNRVPFISVCSLLWTCFLAYMKQKDHTELNKGLQNAK